jgi:hypothetical protein
MSALRSFCIELAHRVLLTLEDNSIY